MALAAGARLGPYEIVAPLGAGGMGEVYRARDAKLSREVALKILPGAVALDPNRLARFQREAQVLASINHPGIAAIYGFEESDGVQALVLELVEGSTLAERIARGPMPLADVVAIARQICEALDAAHQQGIVHRDLKPANIKIRPDGVVKLLDFGLAKAVEPTSAASDDATTAPTITSPAMTQVGMILGTPGYMSPGQASGRPADKRDDVWAFGSVLYEMLTGARAFQGEDVSDTLAAVLGGSPDWTLLSPDLPPGIRTLVTGCLARDRQHRIGDVSVTLFLLREPAIAPAADSAAPLGVTPKRAAAPPLEAGLRRGTFLICLAIAFGILAYLNPRSIFFPAGIILGAIGAGNLIYYFIARRRTPHPPERS
jgi:eukaryotic-like serine/threonine-protein kinase